MITIYTGVPGSGKTYKMVYDLNELLIKEPGLTVYSNINGLKLPCLPLENFIEQAGGVDCFFDFDFQKNFTDGCSGIVYVIDECQILFPKGKKLPNAEIYFQKHRHLGHHILLATQSITLINHALKALIEIEYAAARRTVSFFGEILYREKSPASNMIIGNKRLRPKKEIFALYKSFEHSETIKPKPRLFLMLIMPLLLLTGAFWFFYSNYVSQAYASKNKTTSHSQGPIKAASVYDSLEYKALLDENAKLKAGLENLTSELLQIKAKLQNTERIYLPVIKTGGEVLTIDPDNGQVVPVESVRRRVYCSGDPPSCYYEQVVLTEYSH